MNVHEVAGVLAYLGSGWPSWKVSDDTADVWANELAPLHVDQAKEAARNLIRISEHQPTVAAFLEQYRQIGYHRRIANPTPALEAGADSDPDFDFPAAAADLRAQLANWSAKGHNHKGPGPCPTCAERLAKERA